MGRKQEINKRYVKENKCKLGKNKLFAGVRLHGKRINQSWVLRRRWIIIKGSLYWISHGGIKEKNVIYIKSSKCKQEKEKPNTVETEYKLACWGYYVGVMSCGVSKEHK